MFKNKETLLFELKKEATKYFPSMKFDIVNSFENSILQTFAYLYEVTVRSIEFIVRKMFPQNAVGFVLDLWIQMTYGARSAAKTATGNVWFSGDENATVPVGSDLVGPNGHVYRTLGSYTIEKESYDALSASKVSANRIEITLDSNVLFPSLTQVVIKDSGIVALDDEEFTATVDPLNPAIITIQTGFNVEDEDVPSDPFTIDSYGVKGRVVSSDSGFDKNVSQGEALVLQQTIEGVDQEAYVHSGSIIGGADAETDEEARVRVIRWLQTPITYLNEANIIDIVSQVKSVTRTFIQRATPEAGKAKIFCIKDYSDVKTLTLAEIATITQSISQVLDITHTADDYIIGSPTLQTVNFQISGLTSPSDSLKESIRANMNAVFYDVDYLSGAVDLDLFVSAVANSVDGETLLSPRSFALTLAGGSSLTIGADSVGVLGTITYV